MLLKIIQGTFKEHRIMTTFKDARVQLSEEESCREVAWSFNCVRSSQHSKVRFFVHDSLLVNCTTIFQHDWICKWLFLILSVLHLYYLVWHDLSCNFIFLYWILYWLLPDCSSSLWALIINIYWCLPHYRSTAFLNATNLEENFPPFSFLNWKSTWSFSVINVKRHRE